MKKVLFISPVLPDSNGAGREKRAYRWLHKLQQSCEVELLIITMQPIYLPENLIKEKSITILQIQYNRFSKLIQLVAFFAGLLTKKPQGTSLFGWYPLQKQDSVKLNHLYSNRQYDKILCFRLYLGEFALHLQHITATKSIWLDIDDIESETWNSIGNLLLTNLHFKAGIFHKIAAAQFRVNEQKMISSFNRVFVCSHKDQQKLQSRFATADIHIQPNQIIYKKMLALPAKQDFTMLFVGTLGYYPNEEAIRWFIKNVFKHLRKKHNRLSLIVTGFNPSPPLLSFLLQAKGVTVYENCDDLLPLYSQAHLAVIPLRAGGGTKLKVLEAMQYGIPVIATQEAVGGLDITAWKHYIPAESNTDFLTGCEAVINDSKRFHEMRVAAHTIVNNQYSFNS